MKNIFTRCLMAISVTVILSTITACGGITDKATADASGGASTSAPTSKTSFVYLSANNGIDFGALYKCVFESGSPSVLKSCNEESAPLHAMPDSSVPFLAAISFTESSVSSPNQQIYIANGSDSNTVGASLIRCNVAAGDGALSSCSAITTLNPGFNVFSLPHGLINLTIAGLRYVYLTNNDTGDQYILKCIVDSGNVYDCSDATINPSIINNFPTHVIKLYKLNNVNYLYALGANQDVQLAVYTVESPAGDLHLHGTVGLHDNNVIPDSETFYESQIYVFGHLVSNAHTVLVRCNLESQTGDVVESSCNTKLLGNLSGNSISAQIATVNNVTSLYFSASVNNIARIYQCALPLTVESNTINLNVCNQVNTASESQLVTGGLLQNFSILSK